MNDIFERNHPMKDDKDFITSYWTDRAKDFGALRAKELESPKLKLWIDELTSHIFDSDRSCIFQHHPISTRSYSAWY